MSLHTQIQAWISTNGAFSAGIALLQQCGANMAPWKKYMSQSAVTTSVKTALKTALSAYLPADMPAEVPAKVSEPVITSQKEEITEPAEILQLREKGRRLLKERSRLHALLSAADDDTARFRIADDMMRRVQPEIDRIYNWIHEFHDTGSIPPAIEHNDVVKKVVSLMRKQHSLKTIISRIKKDLRTAPEKEKDRLQKELRDKSAELAEIIEELGL